MLSTESTVALYGTLTPVPEGKQVSTPGLGTLGPRGGDQGRGLSSWSSDSSLTSSIDESSASSAPQASGGHELHCDFWELIGLAPAGGADNLLNEESDVDVQLNNRHMLIRGENVSKILRVRSTVTQCFRDHFFSQGYYEVASPPTHTHTRSSSVQPGSALLVPLC